ncbi:MAG: DUF559 domain-containing protein [Pedobacter sp.]|nr:MAG: DUF559 domain-containing protein [Pedobacter sp.]
MNNNYNKELKGYARNHRNDGTKAEIRIWCELLRNKQFCNFSFLKQRPIENFIVDFYCKDLRLIIEIDGLTHQWEENVEKDHIREDRLRLMGYHILRFNDDEVMNDIINVQRTIQNFIETYAPIQDQYDFNHRPSKGDSTMPK